MEAPLLCTLSIIAFIVVVLVNGLVIWCAVRITGGREISYRTSLIMSLIEIVVLYLINGVIFGLFFVVPALKGYQAEPLLDSSNTWLYVSTCGVCANVMNLFLIFIILTFLIRSFCAFKTKQALKGAGLVILIDLMLGLFVVIVNIFWVTCFGI
jgi:hypothetical protein